MAVPYTFGSATSAIPLSQLDSNFATAVTIGNTAVQLGNTVTTLNNMTLANVTVSGATANAVVYTSTSGAFVANSAVISVDSSGNVGIGTASPSDKITVAGGLRSNGATGNANVLGALIDWNNSNTRLFAYDSAGAGILFYTTPSSGSVTERMRIDSSGNLLVGTTSNLGNGARLNISYAFPNDGAAWKSDSTNLHNAIIFINPNGTVGSIRTNGSATFYNTSSDYRLKENIAPMTGALAKVAALKPCTYKWKADGTDGEGFIAHELQKVCPDAVTGEKDGEEMQGVDYGRITPLLTAALQEAIAEIQSLKARVAELEAR